MAKPVDEITRRRSPHYATMKWMADHPEELEGYDEGWVAVGDQRVIAHGPSLDEVIRKAERQGFDDPLLVPVMPYEWIG